MIVCLDLQVHMPLKGTVQLLWHWMWKYLTFRGLICDMKPLLWHLPDRDLLIAWTIRSTDFFYLKTPIRWPYKSVNKKSWLQAVLKYCINFSDLEHTPLCDIYSLKFSLGVWSWELFLYKKQNMIFFSWKEFLFGGVRCSAEGASVWLPETWTYIRSHVSFFSKRPHCYTISRLLFPPFLAEKKC